MRLISALRRDDDRGRRVRRHGVAQPRGDDEVRYAGLHHRRHVGQHDGAVLAGDGQRPELAGLDLAHHRRRVEEAHRHLAVHHRKDGGRRAAIGHVLQAHAGALLEDHAREVEAAADAARAVGELARLGARLRHQVGDGRGRIGGGDDQHVGESAGDADRHEVLQRIVARRLVEADVEHRRTLRGQQQRVAVGRGACAFHGPHEAARAALVVDHDRLAERLGELIGVGAPDDVGAGARREGYDHADRALRPFARPRRGGEDQQDARQGMSPCQNLSRRDHGRPPPSSATQSSPTSARRSMPSIMARVRSIAGPSSTTPAQLRYF